MRTKRRIILDFLIKAIKPSKQIHMGTIELVKFAQTIAKTIIAKTIIAKYRSITSPPYLVQFL